MIQRLIKFIRQVLGKVLPYQNIEKAESIDTPLTTEFIHALDLWRDMYLNRSPWLKHNEVHSLNLASFVCSEIARQVMLEVQWNITSGVLDNDGREIKSERAEYLSTQFDKLMRAMRTKLEQALASGAMTIKPYHKDGDIFFDYTMAWSLYPIRFDDNGHLADVIFVDSVKDGEFIYTRLERHTESTVEGNKVIDITQRVFKSKTSDELGTEVPLTEVDIWSELQPKVTLNNTDGQMFGFFKVANANNVDVDGPMGVSIFNKATGLIEQADMQYSRLIWEFKGSELAIDIDPLALRSDSVTGEVPQLSERLFRAVNIGEESTYKVFSPMIRDHSLRAGLNQLLMRIEDATGLARGSMSDANQEARTATELRIIQQRTFATVADNQDALENCLREVVRVMDNYAEIYNLAPSGPYDLSFEWDDSILTDKTQQLQERMELVALGIMSKAELREWFFGETEAQAIAAVRKVEQEGEDDNLVKTYDLAESDEA